MNIKRFGKTPSTALSIDRDRRPLANVKVLSSTLVKLYLAVYPFSKASLWAKRILEFGRIRLTYNLASWNKNLTFKSVYYLSRRKLAWLSWIWSVSWRHLGDKVERCRYQNEFARTFLLYGFIHSIPSLSKSIIICFIRFGSIATFQVPESIFRCDSAASLP